MKTAAVHLDFVRKENLSCGGLLFLGPLHRNGNTAVVRHGSVGFSRSTFLSLAAVAILDASVQGV